MSKAALGPILTPHGRLLLAPVDDAPALPPDLSRRLKDAFANGSGFGLLQLGAAEVEAALPPTLAYWREFGARYVTAVCTHPDVESREHTPIPSPSTADLEIIAYSAPPMTGAEYLSASVLQTLWDAIDTAFQSELVESKASIQNFLRRKNAAWPTRFRPEKEPPEL